MKNERRKLFAKIVFAILVVGVLIFNFSQKYRNSKLPEISYKELLAKN